MVTAQPMWQGLSVTFWTVRRSQIHNWAVLGTVLVVAGCGGKSGSTRAAQSVRHADGLTSKTSLEDHAARGPDWGMPEEENEKTSCYEKCGAWIRRAESFYAQAKKRKEGSSRRAAYARAGDAYELAWRGCSLSQPQGEDLGCEGANEVIPRMLECFEQSGKDSKFIFALLVAGDRRWRLDGGALDIEALRAAAGRAETRAVRSPKDPKALDGLEAATYARIAVADDAKASSDLTLLRQLGGKDELERVTLLAITLAAHHNDGTKHQQALRALGRLPQASKKRVKVLWHSEKGRAHAGMKQDAAAKRSFESMLGQWAQLSGEPVGKLGQAQPAPMQGRERVVEAVGAAHFYAGELLRRQADSMKFPLYRGAKTVAGTRTFLNESVGPYVRKRQKLLIEADVAYDKVAQIKPVAPGRYLVASTKSMGQMWASFVDDVVQSPMPAHVEKDEAVAQEYRRTLQESMQPIEERAVRAFRVCWDAAKQFRIEGDAKPCEAWLRDHAAHE